MTGDVLPCFDASTLVLPDDSSCIITVPITLDIATNHGVIVTLDIATNHGVIVARANVRLEHLIWNQLIQVQIVIHTRIVY